jgi:arabinan endo-1,5-alpha-L-arabinosidase
MKKNKFTHFEKSGNQKIGGTRTPASRIFKSLLLLFIFMSFASTIWAQPPSHDPSRMIRNNDGRYWIFTTGDGIWCMSSGNSGFSDWRAESTPFAPGTWPGWINNYVDGFGGFFWAPDVIKIGGTYYLYYSCAGNGAPAAIGLATASDLSGPWTDQGMIVAGNNAIDPAVYYDNGRLWMAWGNWQSGVDICELNASNGKRLNSTSYHLVDGHVEAPGLYKSGNYYFLFYQRGLCCDGVNSTYYMVVARSTSITGPYTDERVFLPNKNGNIIGPGHFGYGEGKLTYHYYDGNDNGAAKLMITTMGISNGWPVAGITGDDGSTSGTTSTIVNGTYAIIASHSGKALDVYDWGTTNGTNIAQWTYWGGETQQFNIAPVDGQWHRITPVLATDKALDVNEISTGDGANIQIWEYWSGYGQQFRFQPAGTGVWRIINRNSDKCLDVEDFSTEDGANVMQWTCLSGNKNQMFSLVNLKHTEEWPNKKAPRQSLVIMPNPAPAENIQISTNLEQDADVRLTIINSIGQVVFHETMPQQPSGIFYHTVDITNLVPGHYIVSLFDGASKMAESLIVGP